MAVIGLLDLRNREGVSRHEVSLLFIVRLVEPVSAELIFLIFDKNLVPLAEEFRSIKFLFVTNLELLLMILLDCSLSKLLLAFLGEGECLAKRNFPGDSKRLVGISLLR